MSQPLWINAISADEAKNDLNRLERTQASLKVVTHGREGVVRSQRVGR